MSEPENDSEGSESQTGDNPSRPAWKDPRRKTRNIRGTLSAISKGELTGSVATFVVLLIELIRQILSF